jgi:tRNA (guanine26-N2/guanine27-N2)-dimethyltransferase
MRNLLEGKARLLLPDSIKISRKAEVFYNPRMAINRSFSIVFLQNFATRLQKLRIFDMLASTGVRGVRYYLELPGEKELLYFADRNPKAIELLKENLKLNGIENATIYQGDVRKLCLELQDTDIRFNLIDIDPFGSPMHFVYFAGIVSDRRLAVHAITATDLGALYAQSIKATIKKYAAYNSKDFLLREEVALRILIGFVAKELLRHDLGIRVLGYHAFKHFIRIYVEVSSSYYDRTIENLGLLTFSEESFGYLRLLELGDPRSLSGALYGPLWIGELANQEYLRELDSLLNSSGEKFSYLGDHLKHILKYLDLLKQESTTFDQDIVTVCYPYNYLGKLLKLPNLPSIEKVIEKLEEAGYVASRSPLYSMNSIRTNASLKELLKLLKRI